MYGDSNEERLRELSETGKSIRYTGKPIFTMIREALEREYGDLDRHENGENPK